MDNTIPLIDLQPLLAQPKDRNQRQAVALAIRQACLDAGFFYIKNHGIDPTLIAQVFAASKRFFALPLTSKQTIAIEKSSCHRGYFTIGGENLDPEKQGHNGDYKEGLKIGRDLPLDHPLVRTNTPLHGPNQWPKYLPGWQATMQCYYDACCQLGEQLMQAFALALGLAENYFSCHLQGPMATLAPLHYPPQPAAGLSDESQLGAGAHSDFGCLTILAQETVPGLQIHHARHGWLEIAPLENTLVVNIGDMLARWSNDLFASTQHRVINRSDQDRHSLAFFYDPNFHADISCLSCCVSAENPAHYSPTTSGQYLLDRIAESFAYQRS